MNILRPAVRDVLCFVNVPADMKCILIAEMTVFIYHWIGCYGNWWRERQ